jgi:hypothetical protein
MKVRCLVAAHSRNENKGNYLNEEMLRDVACVIKWNSRLFKKGVRIGSQGPGKYFSADAIPIKIEQPTAH